MVYFWLHLLLTCVIGVAVSSVFYHCLAGSFTRVGNALAWVRLLLMNIGTSAATGTMMYTGYQGGAAMLPTAIGGQGFDAQQAHTIMAPFVEPISVSILVILAGVALGGVTFLLGCKSRQQDLKEVR